MSESLEGIATVPVVAFESQTQIIEPSAMGHEDYSDEDEEEEEPKNQLSSPWTCWSQVITSQKHHKPSTLPVCDFDTVEDFWGIFNSLKLPSQLTTSRVDILFFRSLPDVEGSTETTPAFKRISPEWEDVNNELGGEYRISIDAGQDKQWETTILSIIGDSLDFSAEIAGIWLGCGRKAGNTLCLWKRSPDADSDPDSIQKLGDAWMKLLEDHQVPITSECTYIPHATALESALAKTAPTPLSVWPVKTKAE